ncbi:MAG: winged helix-turn-helix domain-containing protein [Xanthomonadales bacterium]|nr:winged helix-turn-helix domain-containing protein [Xanthomonadales bacterium]
MSEWTLFSNHGHVLVCLANNNEARLRDVAAEVGITERAVQNILRELQKSGIVQVSKHGRCNHYQINTRKYLRHPLEAHCSVGKLLALLISGDREAENVVVQKAAEDRSKPVKATTKKSIKDQPEAETDDKKADDDEVKRARKKDGEKDDKQDGPSATDQGSLF